MMAKGIKRQIAIARQNAEREIASLARGFYGRGLSSEGYAAGYRDALDDVLLALNGNIPQRNGWWKTEVNDERRT